MGAALLLPPLIVNGRSVFASQVWQVLAAVFGMVGCAVVWCTARRRPRDKFKAAPKGQGTGPAGVGQAKQLPLVTLTFVTCSVLLFLALPEAALNDLCSLRLDDPGLTDLIRLSVARAVLHDTFGHLFGNAILLGLLGYFLESRLGALRTLGVLFMGSFVAGLIGLNFLLSQVALPDGGPYLLRYPPAGGTGAVAALLGCGTLGWLGGGDMDHVFTGAGPMFRRLMHLWWPLLAALAFWGTFSGHTMPVTGPAGMAGYWGQVGGFLSGLAIALVFMILTENTIDQAARPWTASVLPCATGVKRDDELTRGNPLAADWA
jgi:membrane associated rhomboid family serine protease